MGNGRSIFPSRVQLWQGVVLGTIAHAIWVVPDPSYAVGQGWDGPNYLLNDGSGDRATLTFTREYVVAAFFDLHSTRSPFRDSPHFPFGTVYHPEDYFADAPRAVQEIAQRETFRYLLDDCHGIVQPTITAACWSEGSTLTAREPWTDIFAHGGHLLAIQTMLPEEAIPEWTNEYELSATQVALLRGLFARWMAASHLPIVVEEEERRVLMTQGAEGLAEARQLFAAIGIDLP